MKSPALKIRLAGELDINLARLKGHINCKFLVLARRNPGARHALMLVWRRFVGCIEHKDDSTSTPVSTGQMRKDKFPASGKSSQISVRPQKFRVDLSSAGFQ